MSNRNGDWMETRTGFFYATDPRVDEVRLEDIAHALSLSCRFSGHTKHLYTVAQHCLNVAANLKRHGHDEEIQLMGLLHDASEAYISDLPSPFKKELPEYKIYEEAIERVVFKAFNLEWPSDEVLKIIKHSDQEILYNEALVLMNNAHNWKTISGFEQIEIDTDERNWREVKDQYTAEVQRLERALKKN